jgi:NosR/NirI family transcriptional regulator, nitrous oxide reductase regulator
MNTRQKTLSVERWLGILALVSILIAWFAGSARASNDLLPAVERAMPGAGTVERIENELYAAYQDEAGSELLGYVAIAEASGYGGPLTLAVGVDLTGNLMGFTIIDHKETPSWMKRVQASSYLDDLLGKPYTDAFTLGKDLDGVSGATYSSKAIAAAALEGSRTVAAYLNLPVAEPEPTKIVFGIPEITLIALFAVGYFGHQRKFKYTKQARWVALILGMVVLGFIYNKPLTLSMVNQALLGFWPQWQTNLYWYLLLGGIILVFTVDNKNPYCAWFCPFGAAQECMGAIGGSKVRSPGRQTRNVLKWTQRGLAWFAIVIALWFRNPGISSYEIFGTLFKLVGSSWQFVLLGIVLVVGLFISRPWCTYLCPLHPVDEFIRFVRKWILESWHNLKQKRSA